MIGFFEPCLPLVFTSSRGTGLAFRSFPNASSNLSLRIFTVPPCYTWRVRWDSDPRNLREQVHTDYKSDALSRSATYPLFEIENLETVASQPLIGGRFTTTHAENPATGIQRASSFLNSASGSACALDGALHILVIVLLSLFRGTLQSLLRGKLFDYLFGGLLSFSRWKNEVGRHTFGFKLVDICCFRFIQTCDRG
jgi:hypothetical protein